MSQHSAERRLPASLRSVVLVGIAFVAFFAILQIAEISLGPIPMVMTRQAGPGGESPPKTSFAHRAIVGVGAESSYAKIREMIAAECRLAGESPTALHWRAQLDAKASTVEADEEEVEVAALRKKNADRSAPEKCRFLFFDFGANIGDSLGKFISAGIPSCQGGERPSSPISATASRQSFAGRTPDSNSLVGWSAHVLSNATWDFREEKEGNNHHRRRRGLHPENYCYVGVEGNPVFTSRLLRLQDSLMEKEDGNDLDHLVLPPPVQSVRFYTETVGASADGPVAFYLDTKNAKVNYWGSSLIASHIDVKPEGKVTVDGVTLTTLLRRHVDTKSGGGHIMIKMDIEGGEYALLNEASDSGIFCDLTQNGFRVDVLIEFHSQVRC
jgi:hypothetical protein